ncbi:ShlB/FhaC/HecB family hemolysin secretion/activation protein [Halopseudomonas laoshanensis]|uniref:ShlB/FhaC/HecB family hemolysin secretion/activation protein n=1 Tax=Halopseudomonas laoshanensis TaxID=2268758 RepID=A0A7V7GWH8_9GAMM|nr:ShlB/FhaC/HecB family hemolysin secretion/activation protein [Halopseudomonas laoshanensis]KAA0696662.1 ShlB/FhaC/HecB family hemolysin secretion/activation protein [Halopseudomonas laoshanensis]
MTFALLTLSSTAFAQFPDGGSQLQQIPPSPTLEQAEPEIQVEQTQTPAVTPADSARIQVNSLHLTGQSLYTEAELLSVTGFTAGQELSLGELQQMATRIAAFYHEKGYFVAQAYLPAQEIQQGAVTIAVVEGRYGDISLRNQSNLSDRQVNSSLAGLNSGEVIESSALESRLLLLSDTPGVNVRSTLVPGASVGAADLVVDVVPGQRVNGSIDADNAGNYYTGEYRLGATLNINNLAGQGDVATLRVLHGFDGLNYGRAAYQMQFGRATAGVAYSRMEYELGKDFSDLDANGTADIASVFASYPLIRSRRSNLYAQVGYDYKTFEDRIDALSPPIVVDKNIHVLMTTLRGDHRDDLGRGGVTAGGVTWSTGVLDIETPEARAADDISARRNGNYNKLGMYAMRLQNITERVSLYGAISGQLASKNLDSSEQMSLGGMYGVRAYPQGEAFGDEGYLATLEARYLLAQLSSQQLGQVHLVGFVDGGSVTVNKDPWDGSDNSRTLTGAGVGVNWVDTNNFSVKASYARKLGSEDATAAPDSNGRFWVQLVKYF